VLNYQTKQTQALEQVLAAEKIAPGDAYVETIVTRVRDWNNDLAAAASAVNQRWGLLIGARATRALALLPADGG
jgi:hypothetical protein